MWNGARMRYLKDSWIGREHLKSKWYNLQVTWLVVHRFWAIPVSGDLCKHSLNSFRATHTTTKLTVNLFGQWGSNQLDVIPAWLTSISVVPIHLTTGSQALQVSKRVFLKLNKNPPTHEPNLHFIDILSNTYLDEDALWKKMMDAPTNPTQGGVLLYKKTYEIYLSMNHADVLINMKPTDGSAKPVCLAFYS